MILVHIKKFSILKFIITGLLASIIDIGLLYIFVSILKGNLYFCVSITFIIANFFAFRLNKFWTFKNKSKNHNTQYLKYLLISTIGLLLTLIIIFLLKQYFGLYYIFTKIIAGISVGLYNYCGHKFWTFKKYI